MRFFTTSIAMVFLTLVSGAIAQDATPCCNANLPVCPTPAIKFGVGPACCPGEAVRC
ncbi:hypothetical protein M422DRAFT_29410 [Sphaerobolus stellatus SS14]|uniref:Hydrophobin n=1 Tax=Sphaerobolus stellatus (strain SS14) TaxID=990650 RepID=A0A0C9W4K0_SPHS4|nr:hypothetical protein M422DRAFT_29410 [Sphaerobolus stellatus SS14]